MNLEDIQKIITQEEGISPLDPSSFNPFAKNPNIWKFFTAFGWTDEIGSGIRNTNKYLPLYVPGAKPIFTKNDTFRTEIPLRYSSKAYFAESRGKFLYLKRKEYGKISPFARLTYTGDIKKWEFAIFKWTSEKYDPDEWFFPGSNLFDETIEEAIKVGLEVHPV